MKLKFAIFAVVVALIQSGCQTTNVVAETPDELKTMRQAKITWTAGGAAAGAAVGAGIAALRGGSTRSIVNSGLAGALAGGAIGHTYGAQQGGQTIEKKRGYHASEQELAQQISKAQTFNNALISYNNKLSRQIAAAKASSDSGAIRGHRKTASTVLAEVNSELGTRQRLLEAAVDGPSKNTLTEKKNALATQRNELQQHIAELQQLEQTTKV